jgi:hypothetical protein
MPRNEASLKKYALRISTGGNADECGEKRVPAEQELGGTENATIIAVIQWRQISNSLAFFAQRYNLE